MKVPLWRRVLCWLGMHGPHDGVGCPVCGRVFRP